MWATTASVESRMVTSGSSPEEASLMVRCLLTPGTVNIYRRQSFVDDQDLYTIVITTYIPPRQVGDGPWTPWYADYYHPAV